MLGYILLWGRNQWCRSTVHQLDWIHWYQCLSIREIFLRRRSRLSSSTHRTRKICPHLKILWSNFTQQFSKSQVYFNVPKQKQFRIGIGSNVLIDDFDIFEKVGKYSPYDEYISFDFHKDTIKVNVSLLLLVDWFSCGFRERKCTMVITRRGKKWNSDWDILETKIIQRLMEFS